MRHRRVNNIGPLLLHARQQGRMPVRQPDEGRKGHPLRPIKMPHPRPQPLLPQHAGILRQRRRIRDRWHRRLHAEKGEQLPQHRLPTMKSLTHKTSKAPIQPGLSSPPLESFCQYPILYHAPAQGSTRPKGTKKAHITVRLFRRSSSAAPCRITSLPPPSNWTPATASSGSGCRPRCPR